MGKKICVIICVLLLLSKCTYVFAEANEASKLSSITAEQKVVVLMYHHILPDEVNRNYRNNSAVISLEAFKEQMKYLHENDYDTITIRELEEFIYYKRPLHKSKNNVSILITFDDGYLSNYVWAYPILKNYGFKAIVFSITSAIPEKSIEVINPDKLERISYEQMAATRDVFDFESHSHAFHNKDNDNVSYIVAKSKEEVMEDLQKSINRLGSSRCFAYPYGAYNEQTIDILKELGFKLAFTIKPGYITHDNDPYNLPRFAITPSTSLEKFKKILNSATQ